MVYDYYNACQQDDTNSAEMTYSVPEAIQRLLKFRRRLPCDMLNGIIENAHGEYDEREFKMLFNSDNIGRWQSGKPISRDKAFELAIYFGLELAHAEVFIREYCLQLWLYYGDYRDLIYYFFINKSKTIYLSGKEKVLKCRRLLAEVDKEYVNRSKRKPTNVFEFKAALDELNTVDELECYIRSELERFEKFNMIAYSCFICEINKNFEMYRRKNGVEKTMSYVAEQMSIDFSMNDEDGESKLENAGKHKELLKNLIHGNVYRTGLEATICRKKCVTRKQLIMIFLLNECEDDSSIKFTGKAKVDEISERRIRLNKMLYECGFPILDAYQPYDWLILNALAGIVNNKDELRKEKRESRIENVKQLLSENFFDELVRAIEKDNSK